MLPELEHCHDARCSQSAMLQYMQKLLVLSSAGGGNLDFRAIYSLVLTYGHAQAPLQPCELHEVIALLRRQVDARLLKVVAQGTTHSHRLRAVPIGFGVPALCMHACSGVPCLLRLLPGCCGLVSIQGVHKLAVQALMRVETLHIGCRIGIFLIQTAMLTGSDIIRWCAKILACMRQDRTAELDAGLSGSMLPVVTSMYIAAELCCVVGLADLQWTS